MEAVGPSDELVPPAKLRDAIAHRTTCIQCISYLHMPFFMLIDILLVLDIPVIISFVGCLLRRIKKTQWPDTANNYTDRAAAACRRS
jgi:hypothetical protein